MTNCAKCDIYVTSTFCKNCRKWFDDFTFVSVFCYFDLPNGLKIQIWPDPPNIIWGCPNFSFLRTFRSGHSFCPKKAFKIFETLSNEKNFVKSRHRLGVGVGWARPSPAQARKNGLGRWPMGPKLWYLIKILIKLFLSTFWRNGFFYQIEIFQIMPKLIMKLSLGNLAPLTIFSYIFIGPIWCHLGQPMGWAGLGWAFLILAQPSPSRKIPAHADPYRRPFEQSFCFLCVVLLGVEGIGIAVVLVFQKKAYWASYFPGLYASQKIPVQFNFVFKNK